MTFDDARKGMRVVIHASCPWHARAESGEITVRGRYVARVKFDGPGMSRVRARVPYDQMSPANAEDVPRVWCVYCTLQALSEGRQPPNFGATMPEHLATYHPRAVAISAVRAEVIRRIEQLLRDMML